MDAGLLTEERVRALVPEKIFRRGDRYCESGAVLELARRGEVLHALVAGSREEPYMVQVTTRGDRILARCDCPYVEGWGEWCKHVVAVLLAAARHRGPISVQPTVRELLAPVDRPALERIVALLVDRIPRSYHLVEELVERERRRSPPADQ